jgi:hypothetical protein
MNLGSNVPALDELRVRRMLIDTRLLTPATRKRSPRCAAVGASC